MAILDIWQDIWGDVWQSIWGGSYVDEVPRPTVALTLRLYGVKRSRTSQAVTFKRDIGIRFVVFAVDGSDDPFDLSSSSLSAKLVFRKPSGGVLEVTATKTTGGADGAVHYDTADGDVDEVGSWRVQLVAEALPAFRLTSEPGKFRVYDDLRDG